MRKLPDGWIEDLRNRNDIVDVVASYVELKQKGRRFWGRCPFHGEKTPSFSVDSESQMFYCFGCHKGGTVINFVMEEEHMEFMEAIRFLADRAHIEVPALEDDGVKCPAENRELKDRLLEANREAARFYHRTLWTPEGATALTYLHKRGLDDSAIKRFGLGATPAAGDGLTRYLLSLGYKPEELKQVNLTGEKDGRLYDVFRNRAQFPIINAQGNVLGFGGRVLGDGNPKYLNTSDTPVFNKRQGVYAWNMLHKERGLKRVIIVEGYMDVVSLRSHGIPGVVATLGTALTEEQARLVKRYAPEIWVCYDGDSAGQKAILRAIEIFSKIDVPIRVLDIPGDMDPDDYVKKEGAAGFEALKPIQPCEYRMLRAADGLDLEQPEDRTRYTMACCKILCDVKSSVELDNYLKKLSLQTGYTKEVLQRQMGQDSSKLLEEERKREEREMHRLQIKNRETPETPLSKAEMMIIRLLSEGVACEESVLSCFVTPLYREVAGRLMRGEKLASILESLSEEERNRTAKALADDAELDDSKHGESLADCIIRLKIGALEKQIEDEKTLLISADEKERILHIQNIQRLTAQKSALWGQKNRQ